MAFVLCFNDWITYNRVVSLPSPIPVDSGNRPFEVFAVVLPTRVGLEEERTEEGNHVAQAFCLCHFLGMALPRALLLK